MRDKIDGSFPRWATGAPCRCGGYAEEMEQGPTKEEIKKYDCGGSGACCTAAFKCKVCKAEFIVGLDAPDME